MCIVYSVFVINVKPQRLNYFVHIFFFFQKEQYIYISIFCVCVHLTVQSLICVKHSHLKMLFKSNAKYDDYHKTSHEI